MAAQILETDASGVYVRNYTLTVPGDFGVASALRILPPAMASALIPEPDAVASSRTHEGGLSNAVDKASEACCLGTFPAVPR